jgi:hypothetical protein
MPRLQYPAASASATAAALRGQTKYQGLVSKYLPDAFVIIFLPKAREFLAKACERLARRGPGAILLGDGRLPLFLLWEAAP